MAHRILNVFRPVVLGCAVLASLAGCEKLSEGVVREIQFPEHTPELAVTFLARPQADSLVARTHASAGILDTAGSQKVKEAEYTLTHSSGTTVSWGGQDDWVQRRGHALTDVDLQLGTWTLTVEAPGYETATAVQTFPPVIDSVGSYAYAAEWSVVDSTFSWDPYWNYGFRSFEFRLTLPDRAGVDDLFLLRSAQKDFDDEESWESGQVIWLESLIEDDPRTVWNESLNGFIIQDVPGTQALESLPFEVQQEIWGEDLEEALESAPRLELVALSPEMVLFYRRLDEIRNGGGGLFFSEPILAYSNMSSGYGCFGLYTSTPIDLD